MEKQESKTGKQMQWEENFKKIEFIGDRLGKPIDENIKETVNALMLLGFTTTSSCEGHLDWGIGGPYIDIESSENEPIEEELHTLSEKGRDDEQAENMLRDQIEMKNLEERKKLLPFLEEFYQKRKTPYESIIIIQSMGRARTRLQNQGAELQKIETNEQIKQKKLEQFQKEMRDFSEFLKNKFFD